MTTEKPKAGALATVEATSIAALSTFLGFPVPPTLALNVISAAGALITSAADVGTAWFQAKAKGIRADAEAKAAVVTGTVPIAVKTIGKDAELAERATLYLGGRMLREQKNREAVVEEALDQLRAEPAIEDAPGPIDEDWLNHFARLAETRTDETVRTYFARILSGEIRKPGSFAPMTMEVLARLTPDLGILFQRLCSISTQLLLPAGIQAERFSPWVVIADYDDPGLNGLDSLGLSNRLLLQLEDAGLVQHETSFRSIPPRVLLGLSVFVGGRRLLAEPVDPDGDLITPRQISTLNFTRAGDELQRIARLTPDPQYEARLVQWVAANLGVRLKAPQEDTE